MSGYKTFTVAGAGNIGQLIVEELLKFKSPGGVSSVTVLTRNGGYSNLAEQGAKIVTVDYSSPSSLISALEGTDVVISTLKNDGLVDPQNALAEAAKQANAKLFVPSEFGNPTEGRTGGIWGAKNQLHRKLEEMAVPYALFYTGAFADWFFNPDLGWDFARGKVFIRGDGDTPISFTHRRDIGRFVAYVLTHLPPSQLEWKAFRIEGDRKSWNEILEKYQSQTGESLQVTRQSRAQLREVVQKNPDDHVSLMHLELDEGHGVVGKPEELSNKLYPEFNPSDVVHSILEGR
ncbi:NAD-binding protein [Heliocybe sulcata]|uniref:NAD-binding protein n=1 Tax=Heliocybe sulcata TaxID=5364 RepID=A0A5C3MRR1_9AGAM|nr:NAD-binding protein [Heliocybe sulcata]